MTVVPEFLFFGRENLVTLVLLRKVLTLLQHQRVLKDLVPTLFAVHVQTSRHRVLEAVAAPYLERVLAQLHQIYASPSHTNT